MFKLVVLSFLAAAVAEPSGLFYSSPLAYSTLVAPATTTITKSASSVVHPSPFYSAYATPLAYSHFIKKRSAQFYPYYAHSGLVSAPLTTRFISTPVVHRPIVAPYAAASLPLAPLATTHFIKKRSAPLLSTGAFIAPTTYAAPYLTSTYAATAPIYSSPFYSTPIAYSTPITHFIKKRSAQFLTPYLAPTSYTHQSRIDLINHPSPILKVASYHAPLNFPVLV